MPEYGCHLVEYNVLYRPQVGDGRIPVRFHVYDVYLKAHNVMQIRKSELHLRLPCYIMHIPICIQLDVGKSCHVCSSMAVGFRPSKWQSRVLNFLCSTFSLETLHLSSFCQTPMNNWTCEWSYIPSVFLSFKYKYLFIDMNILLGSSSTGRCFLFKLYRAGHCRYFC